MLTVSATSSSGRTHAGAPARTILFAGGGTGGHLSPGIAVAESILRRQTHEDHPIVPRFACSSRAIDRAMLLESQLDFRPIDAAPFGSRPRALARFLRSWSIAKRQTDELLDDGNVSVVLALGGFVAAPVVKQAHRRGVPVIMLNLDATPGKANRFIARWCDTILSVCDTPTLPGFARERVNMPLRQSTIAPGDAATCRKRFGLDGNRNTLVVTGASQGAQSLNRFMIALTEQNAAMFSGWQILHLAGAGHDEEVRRAYERASIPAYVCEFHHAMGEVWGAADLAISRAGANSVAEIAHNAVPGLFFPYPYHRDAHQEANAKLLVDLGGAFLLTDHIEPQANLNAHSATLQQLLANLDEIAAMRARLESAKPANGSEEIAQLLLNHLSVSGTQQ